MTDNEKVRGAGTREPDRLAAGLDSAGIVAAAKATRELATTHRVYAKTWLIDSRHTSIEEANNALNKFAGRLLEEDRLVHTDAAHAEGDSDTFLAMTRLWTPAGEWRAREDAEAHRERIIAGEDMAFKPPAKEGDPPLPSDSEVVVVVLNSKHQHELTNYGKLLLPESKK